MDEHEPPLPAGSPIGPFVDRAESRAREDRVGVGAAVVSSAFTDGVRRWESIVSDGREWHYVTVLGTDLGAHPDISAQDVERGIERFAATLPADERLRSLLNENPLHIDRAGVVRD
jgi:hypothetical protein